MDRQEVALDSFVRLMRSAATLEKMVKKDVQKYGLNVTEFAVLELLFHKGMHTTQAIKEKILIASSSTTYVLDQLEKKGCITRQVDKQDKRVIFVSITTEGAQRVQAIFPEHASMLTAYFDGLTLTELNQLNELLKKNYQATIKK